MKAQQPRWYKVDLIFDDGQTESINVKRWTSRDALSGALNFPGTGTTGGRTRNVISASIVKSWESIEADAEPTPTFTVAKATGRSRTQGATDPFFDIVQDGTTNVVATLWYNKLGWRSSAPGANDPTGHREQADAIAHALTVFHANRKLRTP